MRKAHATRHFLWQRFTAVCNMILSVMLIYLWLVYMRADYSDAHAFLSMPFVAITLLLFIVNACWHMDMGMQSVIDDYVHHPVSRYVALGVNHCAAFAIGLIGGLSILKIFLG